ncbi:lytic transglycosylase domain-containing protein [Allosphingosinicella vermicomposti]|uniref:lytic transglycosylase domain-containing protein n=1 Tax=Allosphingosinicella vermicomposti TaxID=614671 RepID=UPI000D0FDBB8|nr:lytic transglycosylase domain-containing protein [Allosphingosinicella vermicomposti]
MTIVRAALLLAASTAIATPVVANAWDKVQAPAPAPSELNAAERAQYREVFAAIRGGRFADAAARLDGMRDGPLHAFARAELYTAKDSPEASLEQLSALLARAPELPQAAQLVRLAARRGATALPSIPQPQRFDWAGSQPRRERAKSVKGDPVAAQIEPVISKMIVDDQPAAAETLLISREAEIGPQALTELQQRIAWSYYLIGDNISARRLADKARRGVGDWALQGEWTHGLASWRMQDCDNAAYSFGTVAGRSSDAELAAAGHYWAARADMMCGRPQQVQGRLRVAARANETFYGLLAATALGMKAPGPGIHNYRDAEWRNVAGRPNVKAAIALAEIGETDLAGETIQHQARINPADHDAMLHLASDLSLAQTQMWLAHNVPSGKRVAFTARYPAPDWRPARGWRVDPSLAYAHALQESNFRTKAVSHANAHGVMQVVPGTAGDIARKRGDPFSREMLFDPNVNVEYGQSYLEYLRDYSGTGGLLPKVIAAYNAGPAPISRWNEQQMAGGDPLLYIESIPYWETRGYVPIILRNYWVYEQQAGKTGSASRQALAQGMWPRFPGLSGPTAVRIAPQRASTAYGSP